MAFSSMTVAKPTILWRWNHCLWRVMPEESRLRHQLRELTKSYDLAIADAENKRDYQKREELHFFAESEARGLVGRLKEIETEYWSKKARRYHIPIPDRGTSENWKTIEDMPEDRTYSYLSEIGIFNVRGLIRDEQKYRREARAARMTIFAQIVGAAIGVGGTLIGILSAMHRK